MSVRRRKEFAALATAGWTVQVEGPWARLRAALRRNRSTVRRWSA